MKNVDIEEVRTLETPSIGNNGVKVIRILTCSCQWDIKQDLAGQAQCNQAPSRALVERPDQEPGNITAIALGTASVAWVCDMVNLHEYQRYRQYCMEYRGTRWSNPYFLASVMMSTWREGKAWKETEKQI